MFHFKFNFVYILQIHNKWSSIQRKMTKKLCGLPSSYILYSNITSWMYIEKQNSKFQQISILGFFSLVDSYIIWYQILVNIEVRNWITLDTSPHDPHTHTHTHIYIYIYDLVFFFNWHNNYLKPLLNLKICHKCTIGKQTLMH